MTPQSYMTAPSEERQEKQVFCKIQQQNDPHHPLLLKIQVG